MLMQEKKEKILEVKNLKIYFDTEAGVVKALENVSYSIYRGEILGVVGETGSGKSISSQAIMGLIPQPPGKILDGQIIFEGEDLLKKTKRELREIRGTKIAMIFQEPMTSLNPVFTVEEQMMDVLLAHDGLTKSQAKEKIIDALHKVRLQDPDIVLKKYPHQLSGGMRQRIMIAMALSCNPSLLIADEPTTALDVTIQNQILGLLKEAQKSYGLSVLLITHDLGIVAQVCDHVAVMYAGYVVEYGTINQIFSNPLHPYTQGLLSAIPPIKGETKRLRVIKGQVPDLIHPPTGCRFHPRCDYFEKGLCDVEMPRLEEFKEDDEHFVACFNPLNKRGVN
jgi:oligopeptide/dipeptide ABC transporter ATP-binding protein